MSDKIITELTEKTSLADADLIVVEGAGVTWKAALSAFKEYFFSLIPLLAGVRPNREDSVILQQFTDSSVRRVPLKNLLPAGVVVNDMLADGDEVEGTGIKSEKLAPSSVTHSKLAVDSVHTHNLADAEIANADNYPSKNFGTGITESKITDGAVTGIKGGVPPGAVFHFAALDAPRGYLVCNGDVISPDLDEFTQDVENWRLASLRILLGSTYGESGKLPDLRGISVRGYGGDQGGVGRHGVALYRDRVTWGFLDGSGLANLGNDTYLATTHHYVIEVFKSDGTRQLGDAIYTRSVKSLHVTKAQKVAALNNTFGTGISGSGSNRPYIVYAMRYLKSGDFGAYQESSYMRHYHPTCDVGHAHANTASFTGFPHKHGLRIPSVATETHRRAPGLWVLRPWDKGGDSTWKETEEATAGGNVTLDNKSNTALSLGMNSYTGGDTFNGSDLYPAVDENRPHNLALLPCIKY
jgi:hypothetical protein